MAISSKRIDQLIARRKFIKPKRYARWLHHLDGINPSLPTAPALPEEPFTRDPNPVISPIPPDDIPNTLSINSDPIDLTRVHFGTTTVISINPSANNYRPYGSDFDIPPFPWNIHAHLLQQFVDIAISQWHPRKITDKLDCYWRAVRNERNSLADPEPTASTTDTPPTYYSSATEDTGTNNEDTTDSDLEDADSDTGLDGALEQRQTTIEGIRGLVQASASERHVHPTTSLPHLTSLRYNRATLYHCDTGHYQFDIIPGRQYHFNDVTITENRGNLEIRAICPEIIDTDALDISTATTPPVEEDSIKTPSAADDPTYSQPDSESEDDELDYDEESSDESDADVNNASGTPDDAIDLTQSDCENSTGPCTDLFYGSDSELV